MGGIDSTHSMFVLLDTLIARRSNVMASAIIYMNTITLIEVTSEPSEDILFQNK